MNRNNNNSGNLSNEEEMKLVYGDFTPLDILIAMYDFMDSINIFAYKNWMKGRIVEGPFMEKYWIEVTAMFPYEDMPDPSAGMRMIKRGCDIKFSKSQIEVAKDLEDDDYDVETMKPEQRRTAKKKKKVWTVTFRIPRKIIDQLIEEYKEPVE